MFIHVSFQNSPYSRGVVLRLEGLLETLQDRRRTADQMFRLQLQRPDSNMETGGKLSWVTSPTQKSSDFILPPLFSLNLVF